VTGSSESARRGESSVRMSTSDYTLLLLLKATALECPTERRLAVSSDEPLVEETEHLATDLLAPRLLMIQNTVRGGEHNHAEETRGKETADPVLDVRVREIVTGAVMRGGGDDVSFPRRTESASDFSPQTRHHTGEAKHGSREVVWTARGTYLMTPHLLMRPLSSTTILPDLWSSMYSNSLM